MAMKFILADGLTLRDINPYNHALKNDYLDNLLSLTLLVITSVRYILTDDIKINVIRGFISNQALNAEFKTITKDLHKHTKGNAIKISWKPFIIEHAIKCGRIIYDTANKEFQYKIIIDTDDSSLTVISDMLYSSLIVKNKDKTQTIIKNKE